VFQESNLKHSEKVFKNVFKSLGFKLFKKYIEKYLKNILKCILYTPLLFKNIFIISYKLDKNLTEDRK